MSDAVPEVFPPTLREVLLRPRWIGMLIFCLVVAGVFAWLGQWQLGRAIDTDPVPEGATEVVRPIAEVVEPGAYLPEPFVGQKVEVSGWWIGPDFLIVESRFNDGVEGYWVTGQFRLWDGELGLGQGPQTSIAVALAWAPTREDAEAAAIGMEGVVDTVDIGEPAVLRGRLVSDEGPAMPPRGEDPQTMTRMSPAALLGQWTDVEGLSVYRPYLVSDDPTGGMGDNALVAIHSPAPSQGSSVNWLNIFYAAEWAVFAGFAFYIWYRLAKDQWEKEVEELEDAAAAASMSAADPEPVTAPDGPEPARG
ncbi:SURF1 family cytochrome oxidase biogenesis protein [Microbacterium hominis]|uniref:SURF1-like protein n=1 Tax=Microbacterium hominis TaxID=162426 RepID=A0A7D4U5M1_9MICO|nr:SURF1 family cytochrome oxidase biogenesis protein [Microbacterium hominis]QKJ20205.1 SURF1 family protein [Microbacterium hominis]